MSFYYAAPLHLTLAKSISAGATTLHLDRPSLENLNAIPLGDYVYLTIQHGPYYEVVRYTHNQPLALDDNQGIEVERDLEAKGPQSFPKTACIKVDLDRFTLEEVGCVP